MHVTKTQIARYVFLPGVASRLKDLKLNLGWLAYLMALVFAATRVLPANHPYLSPARLGTYGISDILFEAGRNLRGGLRHIDQYLIYIVFVLGIILLAGQFALLLFVIMTHTADAAFSFKGMFVTPYPNDDVALMMLDKVFEIPNMFHSQYDPVYVGVSKLGNAMHKIIMFYNQGMMMIAGLIVVYYIFAVILETMQTGTPFGERFQEVFVPIRIMIAIALLLPLGYGLSAGQMLVLKLASWGSGFATNGWVIFNARAELNPLGAGGAELLANPKIQEIEDLLRFYSLVHSCRSIYKIQYGKDILPYMVYKAAKSTGSILATNLDYDSALDRAGFDNIKVIYGEKDDSYSRYAGTVKPYCGSIDLQTYGSQINSARLIQETYWTFLQLLWTDPNLKAYGSRMANRFTNKPDAPVDSVTVSGWSNPKTKPEGAFYANVRAESQAIFAANMREAHNTIRTDSKMNMQMTDDIMRRGWGGAGIWFNKIAEYNGALMSSNAAIPVPSSFPAVMKRVLDQKRTTDNTMSTLTQFTPSFANKEPLKDMVSGGSLDNPAKDSQIAKFLGDIYGDMTKENTYGDGAEAHDNNVIANMFSMVFGTEGLSELRGNQQIHPLAKMSALGRSILDRAIMYMGGAMVMGGLSGVSTLLDNSIGSSKSFQTAFSGIGGMFISFATVGVTIGVVLYYVIPFLPFLYFFFAVGRWVKSIFEAVIGVPLWALAHLRIDGEGIPGPAAAQGYLLLLEILLRPILVIFGLMAAVSTFSALAIALDTVFDLVTKNVGGYSPTDETGAYNWNKVEFRRSDIDQFFYTIVYAVLLYMMALSCFKLIDLIPNSILRFIGNQVSEFNDQMNIEQDAIRTAGLATYSLAPGIAGAGQQLGSIAGQAAVLPANMALEVKGEAERMAKLAENAGKPPQQQQPQQPAPQQQSAPVQPPEPPPILPQSQKPPAQQPPATQPAPSAKDTPKPAENAGKGPATNQGNTKPSDTKQTPPADKGKTTPPTKGVPPNDGKKK